MTIYAGTVRSSDFVYAEMLDARPLWQRVADVNTDNELEAQIRRTICRVERDGGASDLMTDVVSRLSDALRELKTQRLGAKSCQ